MGAIVVPTQLVNGDADVPLIVSWWVREPGALSASVPLAPPAPASPATPSRASSITFLPSSPPECPVLGRIGVVAEPGSTVKSATPMLTHGGVHVAADLGGKTHTATPTPPSIRLGIHEIIAAVDVIAELDATGTSVTPTAANFPSCALLLVGFLLMILLLGAPPPAFFILLLLQPPVIRPVWEDAFSKAVKQALLRTPRAGSLVARRQEHGGRRWRISSAPDVDGEGHPNGLLAALQLGAPSTPLVEGRSGSLKTGAPAFGLVWHPAIRAARYITIRASGNATPVSLTRLR